MNPISAKIIEPAAGRILSLDTIRKQCEVVPIDGDSDSESHPDDSLLLAYLDAATDHAEKFTGRSILVRNYEFALDAFPGCSTWSGQFPSRNLGIEIPYPPLIEVLIFTAGEDSDSELEVGENFIVDTYGDKAVLRPLAAWPTVTLTVPNQIRCQYRAGYASEEDPDTDAEPLPGGIKAAILLMVEHLYRNRGATDDAGLKELPLGVEALLRPWRVLLGMA